MSDSTVPVLNWAANVESDLAGYRVYYGLQPGVYSGLQTVLQPLTTRTFTMLELAADGLWNFAISAYDTTGNESAKTAAVSRRVVRTASKIRVRR